MTADGNEHEQAALLAQFGITHTTPPPAAATSVVSLGSVAGSVNNLDGKRALARRGVDHAARRELIAAIGQEEIVSAFRKSDY